MGKKNWRRARTKAYKRVAAMLGKDQVHMGEMSVEECHRVIVAVTALRLREMATGSGE